MLPIEIIHQESFFAVVNKPAGLFTQAAPGIESLETLLVDLLRKSDQTTNPFVGLPHRLDRGTSGIVLIACNQRALKRFGEQFHSRKVAKRYWAVVEGSFSEDSGRWIDWVRKIPDRPVAEIVESTSEGAKEAILDFQCLARDDRYTLLEIELHTGRMHQIRLQAASRGFPIVGDWTYGSQSTWGELDQKNERQCFALHAGKIGFHHPQKATWLEFKAMPPKLWTEKLPAVFWDALSMR